jgi:SAM-dependent methyltransferase
VPPALLAQARSALGRRARRTLAGRDRVGRRLEPLGRHYGYERGTPVDRVYIDGFLDGHRDLIRGRVLDVGDDAHVRRFGTRVEQVDVLHPPPGAPGATVVGDLETGEGVPRDAFDCILLLETLPCIFDLRRAVQAVHDALRPGGTVLATANGLARSTPDWPDFWRLTSASMERLFAERFGPEAVEVSAYGNVLTASAYLYGVAAEELERRELAFRDPAYEVSICLRARRAAQRV